MRFKYLKKAFVISVIGAAFLGLFGACDNPFSNNLGEKVDIFPPVITVGAPISGDYIKGTTTFTGHASASRDLRSIEVKIFDTDEKNPPILDWTAAGITLTGGQKEKDWSFDLDTLNYYALDKGFNDGLFKIQFRAHDPSQVTETVELVYIVKNKPSDVRLTSPNIVDPRDPNNVPQIISGDELRGQITDRRGIMPGFPKIKFWLYGTEEPGDDQWATLFLPGDTGKGYDDPYLNGGYYSDRYNFEVIRAANFALPLYKFTVDSGMIKYQSDGEGNYIPLDLSIYQFRIITRETYFDSNRIPINPPDGTEITGYFPPENFGDPEGENAAAPRDLPITIELISSAIRPSIELDNSDVIPQTDLDVRPNVYINTPTSRKIAAGRDLDPARIDFRLRILATHPEFIDSAILYVTHNSIADKVYLKWDEAPAGQGYVNPANDYTSAKEGYRGELKNPANSTEGKVFTFSGYSGMAGTDEANLGQEIPVFTTSSEPYTLVVTAFSGSGIPNDPPQSYTLYMDGDGPTVNIRAMLGASVYPDAEGHEDPVSGGVINDAAYTVNGNIQVSVDRMDDSGILANVNAVTKDPARPDSYPLAKWIVEEDILDGGGNSIYLSSPGTVLAKLKSYRASPAAAGLGFFDSIRDPSGNVQIMEGWVNLPNPSSTNDADRTHNFKFNTWKDSSGANAWNGKSLWLYVIAQDGVQNLGFVLQKIYVDDDTDFPVLDIPVFSGTNGGGSAISGPGDLYVTVGADESLSGNADEAGLKKNILEKYQGIELNLSDDDGINVADGSVTITLTDLNGETAVSKTLTAAQLQTILKDPNKKGNVGKDWTGVLSQEFMGELLYGEGVTHLPDGMYSLTISGKDDIGSKVAISGGTRPGDQPGVASDSKTFYFAVSTETPDIAVLTPAENDMLNTVPADVVGTVKSRVKVQRLWITFAPNVLSPGAATEELLLYADLDSAMTSGTPVDQLADVGKDEDGYYTYYWRKTNVSFGNVPSGFADDRRMINLKAYDGLGAFDEYLRTVQMDSKAPDIDFNEINYGRPGKWHGKVPFSLSVTDENGLMPDEDWEGNPSPAIRWWLLPIGSPDPVWGDDPALNTPFPDPSDPAGRGGEFFLSDIRRGLYTGVIDTRGLDENLLEEPDDEAAPGYAEDLEAWRLDGYKLCVIAVDRAGNYSAVAVAGLDDGDLIKVYQDADNPVMVDENSLLVPLPGTIAGAQGLSIQGVISDDDGFDPAKLGSYVMIRFPRYSGAVPNNDPEDDNKGITWGDWIAVPAALEPSGDIKFNFNFSAQGGIQSYNYFYNNNTNPGSYRDGTKYYQILAKDEPDAGANNRPAGKNPDGAESGQTGYVEAAEIILGPYNFLLITTPPEIYFNKFDPNPDHNSPDGRYSASRPTFERKDNITAVDTARTDISKGWLGGYVYSPYLASINFIYGAFTAPVTLSTPVNDEYEWSVENVAWLAPFDTSDQGPQSITIEANDLAGNTARVAWLFFKDTQGPEIIFDSIGRAITRASIPAASAFPDGENLNTAGATQGSAWPSDWPNGTIWKDGDTANDILAWSASWQAVIADWPSEYAFFTGSGATTQAVVLDKAAKVIAALTAENGRTPSIVSGDTETVAISGKFVDDLSFMWDSNSTTTFQYRFDSAGRYDTATAWENLAKPIETPVSGQRNDTANWIIKITEAMTGGRVLYDGEHSFDIKASDKAGNESEIYGVRFVVDRNRPYVDEPIDMKVAGPGGSNLADGTAVLFPKALEETARVFSAAGATSGGTGTVFELTGIVTDNNLSGLTARLSTDNDPWTFETSLADVPAWPMAADAPATLGQKTWTSTDTDGQSRLTLTAAANGQPIDWRGNLAAAPGTPASNWVYYNTTDQKTYIYTGSTPAWAELAPLTDYSIQYEWIYTFKVLEGDIYTLQRLPNPLGNNDSVKRAITITATDKARRSSGRKIWNFYLDSVKPVIEYTNLEKMTSYTPPAKGPEFTIFDSGLPEGLNTVSLQGIASDDTKIRDVKFSIAKRYYQDAGEGWRWYDPTANAGAGDWVATQPADSTWPSMLNIPGETYVPNKVVNWTLDREKLNKIVVPGTTTPAYPENLFNDEGQYKIDLLVTDWSISSSTLPALAGNPHNTRLSTDTTYSDVGYTVSTGAGNASARKFFVDRDGPAVTYTGDENKLYYSAEADGRVTFTFTVSDANTISDNDLVALVKNSSGAVLSTLSYPADSAYIYISGNQYDTTARTLTVRPVTTALSFETYTLELTVWDGAGIKASMNTTRQFTPDNDPPEFKDISPATGSVVTGQVYIRGSTTDISNLLDKVAFYLAPYDGSAFTAPTTPETGNYPEWHFYQDGQTYHEITGTVDGSSTVLMSIEQGTFTWRINIPNTRNFYTAGDGQGYVHRTTAGAAGITMFDGKPVPATDDVCEMLVYFFAQDNAGNFVTETRTLWIYPEGDRPVLESITNPDATKIEAERLLNGNIRVAGLAKDNERVKNVWFRVLNDNVGDTGNVNPYRPAYGEPYVLSIPNWDMDPLLVNWDAGTGDQTSKELFDEDGNSLDNGWYMANGGNSSNVPWWVYINAEGELEPEGEGANRIRIQVRAEDTTWDDTLLDGEGDWKTSTGMISKPPRSVLEVPALVVAGAPIFEDEKIKIGSSAAAGDWGDPLNTNIGRRAAYQVTVKVDSGLSAIRYTPTSWSAPNFGQENNSYNLLDPTATYNATTYATHLTNMDTAAPYNAATNPGIALKAGPKEIKTTLTAGKTYLIWKPDGLPGGTIGTEPLISDDNVKFSTFVATGGGPYGAAEFIERTDDGYYEWVVTVDVNTAILQNGQWASQAVLYPVYLAATDISKSSPLTSTYTAWLPIDNLPPEGWYTFNRRPAGSNATIGGELSDGGNVPVQGLSRVVAWFALKDGTYVSWNGTAGPVPTTAQQVIPAKGGTAISVDVPNVPSPVYDALGVDISTGGDWAIVVDRNDPRGQQPHHGLVSSDGSNVSMGWASGAGGRTTWYFEFDSTELPSGPVMLHYIVYDKAGNTRYYIEPLVVMNDFPAISRIYLGTDIRGDNNLQTLVPGAANNSIATNVPAPPAFGGIFQGIRNGFAAGAGNDVTRGITDEITTGISGLSAGGGDGGRIRQIEFNARNNLLAFRVETTAATSKTRSFRFEYVTGANLVTDLSLVKAGRAYIINEPGDAAWGALGAEGSSFTQGQVFLAAVNGVDDGVSRLPTYNSGSAWELETAYVDRNVATTMPRPAVRTAANALALPDVTYAVSQATDARSAEFVYKLAAFAPSGSTVQGTRIIDFIPAGTDPSQANSLFIVKIFDGDEEDLFGDFAVLSIRVNNTDKLPPDSRLYDLNPKAEADQNALTPANLELSSGGAWEREEDGNRTMGGIWGAGTAKSGHVEPRVTTGLESGDMDGAADSTVSTLIKPYADSAHFLNYDTVSGRVVLRGYAEGSQRIQKIDIQFGTGTPVTILQQAAGSQGTATTGFLATATTGVHFTDSIDLYRHRVEWAYEWNTQTQPAGFVVGEMPVSAIVTNMGSVPSDTITLEPLNGRMRKDGDTVTPYAYYNTLPVQIRPYITSFTRAGADVSRSRQGWYPLSIDQQLRITGFNLVKTAPATTTSIALSGTATHPALTGSLNDVGTLTVLAADGAGPVRLSVGTWEASNTYSKTPANYYMQPWNSQYTKLGEELWDDFVSVHIWRSDDAVTGDRGAFQATPSWNIVDPSMTIDPVTGTLWANHVELGSGTPVLNASVRVSDNQGTAMITADSYGGSIVNPDIYHNGTNYWTALSRQGQGGDGETWNYYGGIYLKNGGTLGNNYIAESAWYNASENSPFISKPAALSQFRNPHVIAGHISYYDSKDGSVKYRNAGTAVTLPVGNAAAEGTYGAANDPSGLRTWVNLDGGLDVDDRDITLPLPGMPTPPATLNTALSTVNGYSLRGGVLNTSATLSSRYVREVLKAEGDEVVAGDTIYVVGNQKQSISSDNEVIIAKRSGIITNLQYTDAPTVDSTFNTRQALALSGYAISTPSTGLAATVTDNNWATNGDTNFAVNYFAMYNGRPYICIAATTRAAGAPDSNESWSPFASLWPGEFGGALNQINTRGTWSATASYVRGDIVFRTLPGGGGTDYNYICVNPPAVGETPEESMNWTIVNADVIQYRQQWGPNVDPSSLGMVREGQVIMFIGLENITVTAGGSTGRFNRYAVRAPTTGILKSVYTTANNITATTALFTIEGDFYKESFSTENIHAYTIADINTGSGYGRIVNATGTNGRAMGVTSGVQDGGMTIHTRPNVGEHNAIALTSQGYPVVAYFDSTNQKLKLAVSSNATPATAANWKIRDNVIPSSNPVHFGTGAYVSIAIDTRTGINQNRIHIAALNMSSMELVYITGMLTPTAAEALDPATVKVQVVDSTSNVGKWCNVSLDSNGNPWISYLDEGSLNSNEGIKVAYKDGDFYKGIVNNIDTGQDHDRYGNSVTGWETMTVPANFRVQDARVGMECFPARNFTGTVSGTKNWKAAVGYLAPDLYRAAYYMKQQ